MKIPSLTIYLHSGLGLGLEAEIFVIVIVKASLILVSYVYYTCFQIIIIFVLLVFWGFLESNIRL